MIVYHTLIYYIIQLTVGLTLRISTGVRSSLHQCGWPPIPKASLSSDTPCSSTIVDAVTHDLVQVQHNFAKPLQQKVDQLSSLSDV